MIKNKAIWVNKDFKKLISVYSKIKNYTEEMSLIKLIGNEQIERIKEFLKNADEI